MVVIMNKLIPNINDLVNDLQNINLNILKGRLERGNILNRIKKEKAYIGYDSYCNSWHEFLECINLNRETARQDMEIYTEFSYFLLESHKEELMQTSYERLVRLLPIVKKHPETKMELLTMANQSNRKDFDINVKGLKGLRTEDNCHTDFAQSQIYEKCNCCNQFRRRKDLEITNIAI
jgi:hypothetical protein